jgi:hypothetical protein
MGSFWPVVPLTALFVCGMSLMEFALVPYKDIRILCDVLHFQRTGNCWRVAHMTVPFDYGMLQMAVAWIL